ncbi:MAG: tetratricopeptide repeat protein [Oculatellaceae cyanobacterium bins.114]|nr:tetratricopeptide repeat protein [Oculatellaceae cyanobacterium bins.114]
MRASRFIALLTLTLSLMVISKPVLAHSDVEYRQLFRQGLAAEEDQNFAHAESIWQRLLREYGDLLNRDARATLYTNLGVSLAHQERWQEATLAYQRSIALHPTSLGYNNLGVALRNAGRVEEAIATFHQALTYSNEDATATNAYTLVHFNLGDILQQQGNLEAALAEYQQALTFDSNFRAAEEQIRRIQLALHKTASA